jgi:SAM-dependent methyltransferase
VESASFKDHFSRQAAAYERFRPGYPPALFEWLAHAAPARGRALDVGTGNGQAALGLAAHFAEVIATEPSREQLAQARPHPRVSYRVERAEQMQLADASVDLVTAAQAAHWFDLARFAAELRRVLRPGGLVALWTYEKFRAGGAVDRLVDDFYRDVVGPYWPRERRHVEERYSTLALPFAEIAVPAFELALEWDAATALDYLGTWSAVQRYRRLRGGDPLALLEPRLRAAWGAGLRPLRWPIHLRVGRR